MAKESEETQQLQSLTSEAAAGVVRGKFGNFPVRWVLLFLVGAFVFQAIRVFWASGLVNSGQKDVNLDSGNEETRVSDGNGEERKVVFFTGSDDPWRGRLWFREVRNGFVGGSEFENRINEIRAMAREAREKAKLDSTGYVDGGKTGIELEVESELENFRKPGSKMFIKKYSFKGVSPPGGSDDPSITRIKNSSSAVEEGSITNGSVDRDSVDLLDKGPNIGNGKAKENLGKGNEVAKPESGNGNV